MLKKWRRFFRYYIQITYCYCFYRNEVIYYWMILIAIFLDTVVICRWMWNQNIFQEFGASSQWTLQLAVLRECLAPLRCSLLIIHHFTFVMRVATCLSSLRRSLLYPYRLTLMRVTIIMCSSSFGCSLLIPYCLTLIMRVTSLSSLRRSLLNPYRLTLVMRVTICVHLLLDVPF